MIRFAESMICLFCTQQTTIITRDITSVIKEPALGTTQWGKQDYPTSSNLLKEEVLVAAPLFTLYYYDAQPYDKQCYSY